MQFSDMCYFNTASGNSQCLILRLWQPAPVSAPKRWEPPSRAGQSFQHIIEQLHSYCDIVAMLCESEMGV